MTKRAEQSTASKRESVRQKAHEKAHEEVSVRGHRMEQGDVFKFVGFVAFFVLMVVIVVLCWPLFGMLFGEGGLEEVKRQVSEAGPLGMLLLLGLQFLQVVVAVIPGEAVQIVAGLLYGPWVGAAIVLVGCVVSSFVVFQLVHKLGAPFVRSMVPEKYMDKIRNFEQGSKLNVAVFVLFLIPGLPKDVFTYVVPLTSMRLREFLLLSNIARIPGVVVSTYAAHGFTQGKFLESAFLFLVAAIIAVAGLLASEHIMKYFEAKHHK
ncbi:TVP38/TMEM64 family protein [Adlercreutzia sp. ZJ138]|uniref:TVP38/TMEM64 family protein n=1 Tax=Adlercreutzia sp. ZJ138 TaxID=2709405 RepID=UPI0013ECB133|nr:VTT domain-containing protein [Adlercreutzia sp. ZJ138]